MKKVKKVPPIEIILLKRMIKDLTVDLKAVNNEIDAKTKSVNHINIYNEILIKNEMYPLAKSNSKKIEVLEKETERLISAAKTIETIRNKTALDCMRLRYLYRNMNNTHSKEIAHIYSKYFEKYTCF